MPGVKDTEVYRGPDGHVMRQEASYFTQYLAVTAIGSKSRIYASRQGAIKWLQKQYALRQAKLAALKQSEAILREKASILEARERFASQFRK